MKIGRLLLFKYLFFLFLFFFLLLLLHGAVSGRLSRTSTRGAQDWTRVEWAGAALCGRSRDADQHTKPMYETLAMATLHGTNNKQQQVINVNGHVDNSRTSDW